MKLQPKPIDWLLVERLCRLSFTGLGLTEKEQAVLEDAYRRAPEEYRVRTNAVRDEEWARIRSM